MVWPALIGAAATVGAAAYGASSAQGASKQARKFAREQREWDLDVANTAHQRQVADLRAAGLNPILSANSGAPSPNAPGAQTFVPPTPDVSGISAGVSSSLQAKRLEQELSNLDAQEAAARAMVRKTDAEKDQIEATTDFYKWNVPNMQWQANAATALSQYGMMGAEMDVINKGWQNKLHAQDLARGAASAEQSEAERKWFKEHPEEAAMILRLQRWLGPLLGGSQVFDRVRPRQMR